MEKEITLTTVLERIEDKFGQLKSVLADFRQETKVQFEVVNHRMERLENRIDGVEGRLTNLEKVTNGLLGSFVIFTNQ